MGTLAPQWTDELRAMVHPRQKSAVPKPNLDPQETWSKLRNTAKARRRAFARLSNGLRERIDKELDSSSPPSTLHAPAQRALMGADDRLLDLATPAQLAIEGPEFAVGLGLKAGLGKNGAVILRETLLHEPSKLRNRCAALVEEGLSRAPLRTQVALAFVFPSQPWADTIAKQYMAKKPRWNPHRGWEAFQLFASMDDLETARKLALEPSLAGTSLGLLELSEHFGDRAIPIFFEVLKGPRHHKDAARALSVFQRLDVAEEFVEMLRQKPLRPRATEYLLRFPRLAEEVLPPAADGKTKHAKLCAELLARVRRGAGSAADSSPPKPSKKPRKGQKNATKSPPTVGSAPPFLVDRPWNRVVEPPVIGDVPIPDPRPRVEWNRGERAAILEPWKSRPEIDSDALNALLRQADTPTRHQRFPLHRHEGERLPKGWTLRILRGPLRHISWSEPDLDLLLARFGAEVAPDIARLVNASLPTHTWRKRHPLHRLKSAHLALAMADTALRNEFSGHAGEWLTEAPERSAAGLWPFAFGGARKLRPIAWAALRFLRHRGLDADLRLGADPRVRPAVDAWLGADPASDRPRAPQVPDWLEPTRLPPPQRGTGTWSEDAVVGLLELLSMSDPFPPHPGIEAVRRAADPESLSDFAWALATRWSEGKAKKRNLWMVQSLVHFADDKTVRRAAERFPDPAVATVLGTIGTSAAMMELAELARRSKRVGAAAERALSDIAARNGWSRDDLEDRVVPTLSLEHGGFRTLSFGPREFRVQVDSGLQPWVIQDRDRLPRLPPKRQGDDPSLVAEARAAFSEFKRDIKLVAERRVPSLRRSMRSGRRMDFETFRTLYLEHPLSRQLALGLVWQSHDGRKTEHFRVAEDQTFANADDETISVGSEVSLAHPALMRSRDLHKWNQRFEEYALIQPMPQLEHPVEPLAKAMSKVRERSFPRPDLFGPRTADLRDIYLTLYDIGLHGSKHSHPSSPPARGSVVLDDERTAVVEVLDDHLTVRLVVESRALTATWSDVLIALPESLGVHAALRGSIRKSR
ncbi:MAG: DUF4132 domain-containing protein [Myxococcota bacterium]